MVEAEVRDLRLLNALADGGTLQAAARRLHVTPSALSQQLRSLEERLGGPLFERRARRLEANAAGQHLTRGGGALLKELERLERETRTLLSGATATLRIAMSCHQSYRWLPRVLSRYAKLEPRVEVALVAEAAASPFEWLLARRLDVALVTGQLPRDRRLRSRRLFRDELVTVVSREHAWAERPWVPVRAFASEHLFADGRALDAAEPLGAALLAAGRIVPRKLTQVPMTGGVALELVRANLGVTLLPRWTVATQLRPHLAAVRVGPRGLWLTWQLTTRREPEPLELQRFLAVVRAEHPAAARR